LNALSDRPGAVAFRPSREWTTLYSPDAGHRYLLRHRDPDVPQGAGARHFHAEHQSQAGKFDFDGNQTVGNITSRNALRLIREWAQLNRAALDTNWANISTGKPLNRIPPLE
jgi:hypothetical protein